FQKNREKQKKNDGKTGIFTQNQFSTKLILSYGCNSKINHCKFLKFSPIVNVNLNFQKILTLRNLNFDVFWPLKHKPPFSLTTANYILGYKSSSFRIVFLMTSHYSVTRFIKIYFETSITQFGSLCYSLDKIT
ncbi:Uncharacterized protein FWK35_00004145, partial [Aphis craccivora]